jgi:putative transposase
MQPEREQLMHWIDAACTLGATQAAACMAAGITARTLQRWRLPGGGVVADRRRDAVRPLPSTALSADERAAIVATVQAPRFASLPPSQIVPRLADEGVYLASESSFYRVLRAADQHHRRGRAHPPSTRTVTTYSATAANQVWCWDISYLPSPVRGWFFYLYLVLDLYSRKVVGWEVHAEESGEHAAALLLRTSLGEGIDTRQRPLVLHADNGSPMKSATLLATLQWLGVAPSYSRPRVSNDNAYAESFFRTCKYRPEWPTAGFATRDDARHWVRTFVQWYNEEHRHSGLNFVTPGQRHREEAPAVMQQRIAVYQAARARNPGRWSEGIRDWSLPDTVWLNPEREKTQDINQAA